MSAQEHRKENFEKRVVHCYREADEDQSFREAQLLGSCLHGGLFQEHERGEMWPGMGKKWVWLR